MRSLVFIICARSYMEETAPKSPNFFTHVFNFDDNARAEMMNIAQYAIMAVIMVTVLNRAMDTYVPEVDPDKSSLMIFVEIALQVIFIFLALTFIHRIIDFIPTASGVKYSPQNVITIILPTLVLLLSVDVKGPLGRKVALLWDKVSGTEAPKQKPRSTQPLAGGSQQQHQLLPTGINTSNPMAQVQAPIPEPDFNTMFSSGGAVAQDFEPMAANSGGVSFF